MIGETIKGYQIKKELGQGGMAIVYLAKDKKFETEVALKFLNNEFISNQNIRKRFLAEARNMFKMSHPNIVKVVDLIDEDNTVAFAMEYVEGETLKDYIERKGQLNDLEINNFLIQMLAALEYVHKLGMVHRDIKPSNFMITSKGKVKLMDFGIAKNMDPASYDYTSTGTSQQMGTPMYMSPEQVHETKNVTAQSDIYSLGVVLWQMVTGKRPYDTQNLSNFQLQSKIVHDPLPLTNTKWDKIINKSTAKNLNDRYQSASVFLISFQDITDSLLKLSVDTNIERSNDYLGQTLVQNNHYNLGSLKSQNSSMQIEPNTNQSSILDRNSKSIETKKPNKSLFVILSFILVAIIASIVIFNGSFDEGNRNNDSDNDGIVDDYDDCPNDYGTSNSGCPDDEVDSIGSNIIVDTTKYNNSSQEDFPINSKVTVNIDNECGLSETDNSWEAEVSIDGIRYNWGYDIELSIGTHQVTETIINLDDGNEYTDETTIEINNNTSQNEKFTVSLNCACPFFYYNVSNNLIYGGELIRNQNSLKKEKLDSTKLDQSFLQKDTISLVIKEEKSEISYLDNIYLSINDSIKIIPLSSNKKIQSMIGIQDKNYLVLKQGDAVELFFIMPKNVMLNQAKIFSFGYYIPK